MLEKDFKEVVATIRDEIIETQVYIMSDANKRLINLYFKLGKIIYENSKWGNKFIKELETELKLTFSNSKGFSARNLSRMKKIYMEYKEEEILPPAVAKLPWTHNNILIDKLKDKENNFKNTLIEPQSDLANDLQKDSYIFNLPLLKEKYIEKNLKIQW